MDTITNIPVSSLTYALKGQKVLERYGYKAWAGRDHNRVSGCGYQLTVRGDPEKAKELLKDPSLRIGDIAEEVGFLDVAHFSRVFKKQAGISANEYRNTKLGS